MKLKIQWIPILFASVWIGNLGDSRRHQEFHYAPFPAPGLLAASMTEHVKMNPGSRGLLNKVHDPELHICVNGAPTQGQHIEDMKRALDVWLNVVRPIATDKVVRKLVFMTSNDCQYPDLYVNYYNTYPPIRPRTASGVVPTIDMNLSDNYLVAAHEMGHAFGLGDTYIEGTQSPQPGQPESMMSSTKFTQPQRDDVRGVREMYVERFGRGAGEDELLTRENPSEVEPVEPESTRPQNNTNGVCQIGFTTDQFGRQMCSITLNRVVVAYIDALPPGGCTAAYVSLNLAQFVQNHCPNGRLVDAGISTPQKSSSSRNRSSRKSPTH